MKPLLLIFSACCLLSLPCLSRANEADIIKVDVRKSSADSYDFNVTVLHKDTGWKHYADKWDIVGKDGTVFGTRSLLHPHVSEQPFTRSLSNVQIPASFKSVTVRAHDSVHEYGGEIIKVQLPTTR